MKRAVRDLIPQEIVDRPKQGFPAPVGDWFRNLPAGTVRRALFEGPMARREYFDLAFIDRMLDEQSRGIRDWSVKLWVLFNLSAWYARWIEGPQVV